MYDFLDTFRQSTMNHSTEHVWIDAMCIAQNDVLERNHQVAQMGDIYATARSVYVWLGKMPSIAPILSSLKNWQNPTYEDMGSVRSDLLSGYLHNNEYWNRAWITQEILVNDPVPLCMCEITTLLLDLDLYVDSATAAPDGVEMRRRAWDGIYLDVDMRGVQLPETLPLRYPPRWRSDVLPSGRICPALKAVVMSCARKILDLPSTMNRGLASKSSALETPFMFQKLNPDLAQKLSQFGSDVFTIHTANPASREYTLSIPMYSIIDSPVGR